MPAIDTDMGDFIDRLSILLIKYERKVMEMRAIHARMLPRHLGGAQLLASALMTVLQSDIRDRVSKREKNKNVMTAGQWASTCLVDSDVVVARFDGFEKEYQYTLGADHKMPALRGEAISLLTLVNVSLWYLEDLVRLPAGELDDHRLLSVYKQITQLNNARSVLKGAIARHSPGQMTSEPKSY